MAIDTSDTISNLLQNQRRYFHEGKTRSLDDRQRSLSHLREVLIQYEPKLLEALHADMNKSAFEGYSTEVGFTLEEIKNASKHLAKWAKPKRVKTPFIHFPASSHIYTEPLGSVLIIGPWNYPFQLLFSPLVGALAAGNTAILKPSELAPQTSKIVAEMAAKELDPLLVAVVEGGGPETQRLLELRFDHIFFTGGGQVGRIVLAAAAKHLTPVTLELGGKSPCIVDKDTNWELTARRIAWGKFLNAGQTCVAPDYCLVPKGTAEDLARRLKECVESFYGSDPSKSVDYGRIINDRHFSRLEGLLAERPGKLAFGGQTKPAERYLAPTVLTEVRESTAIMQDEIFGPLLPILEYESLGEAIQFVNRRPKPLALYFFSTSTDNQDRVLAQTSFGGGCINETLLHLGNPYLPFGGVGESGMGAYHGHDSFLTFSHRKGVLKKSFLVDVPIRYAPFGDKLRVVKRVLG